MAVPMVPQLRALLLTQPGQQGKAPTHSERYVPPEVEQMYRESKARDERGRYLKRTNLVIPSEQSPLIATPAPERHEGSGRYRTPTPISPEVLAEINRQDINRELSRQAAEMEVRAQQTLDSMAKAAAEKAKQERVNREVLKTASEKLLPREAKSSHKLELDPRSKLSLLQEIIRQVRAGIVDVKALLIRGNPVLSSPFLDIKTPLHYSNAGPLDFANSEEKSAFFQAVADLDIPPHRYRILSVEATIRIAREMKELSTSQVSDGVDSLSAHTERARSRMTGSLEFLDP